MPDNAIYYQLAYAATLVLFVGYTVSLIARRRALEARRLRQGKS